MKRLKKLLNTTGRRFLVALICGFLLLGVYQAGNSHISGEETITQSDDVVQQEQPQARDNQYLDSYLIRYKGIRFGGTENTTGAPITIQSGASISASVAFTLNTEDGTTTSSGIVEKGRIAFRFKIPSYVTIGTNTGIIDYREGSENDPNGVYDNGDYRYYWGFLSEDLDVGSGSTASVSLTPYVNGVTDDETAVEIEVEAFDFYNNQLKQVGVIDSSSETALKNTIIANTDQFSWKSATVTPSYTTSNNGPSNSMLNDLTFTLAASSATTSTTTGVGYAKQITYESTFQLPVDGDGKPYIDISKANFFDVNGTQLPDSEISIDTENNTFTVRHTVVNPDESKEFTDTGWKFVIKGATIDKANTDLQDVEANKSKTFSITAVGGSHQIDPAVKMDVTVTNPYIIGQSAMNAVVITYTVPKVQVGDESYKDPIKYISKINQSSQINGIDDGGKPYKVMPGDLITYQLAAEHIKNIQSTDDVNGGKIEKISYKEVEGTNFDIDQLIPQQINAGTWTNFTSGKITITIEYNDGLPADTLEITPATASGSREIKIDEAKRSKVKNFEIKYEDVNSGFQVDTGPLVTYLVKDQKDIRKNGMVISNSVESTYKNTSSQVINKTKTSNVVDVIYNSISMSDEGIYEHNKTGLNLGGATTRTFPVENDVLLFVIELKNTEGTPLKIDEVADIYTNQYLAPYGGDTTTVGGTDPIDGRYINASNTMNLTYWESDPLVNGNNPVTNNGMNVSVEGPDELSIKFTNDVVIPAGETYYLTYTMSATSSIHKNATIGNTFQSFYEDNPVGEGAFYWGPQTSGTGFTSLKNHYNVTGPDGLIDAVKPYAGDVIVYKATINNITDADWGPGMSVTDTFSNNLIPWSTDQGFNTTGTYGKKLNLNTTMNLGVAVDESTGVTVGTVTATVTGNNEFKINLGTTEIKSGGKLVLYYTMKVTDDVKAGDKLVNTYTVYSDDDSQLTRGQDTWEVNAQQNYEGIVSLTKGSAEQASNNAQHSSDRLRDSDIIEYTVAVSNLRIRNDDGVTFQTIQDTLPENMEYVDDSLEIKFQLLEREYDKNNENNTDTKIVRTEELPLPNDAKDYTVSNSNGVLKVTFDNPVVLNDRYYTNDYEHINEYQYVITYKLKVNTDDIPETTRLKEQTNTVKVFYQNEMSKIKSLNGTLAADTTNEDGNSTTQTSHKGSAKVTLLNDNYVYGGIEKNALVDIEGKVAGANIANANVNVDVKTNRIYNVNIYNYGAKSLPIDKVIDILPQYETIVDGSMILIEDPNDPTTTKELSFTTEKVIIDGVTYQKVTMDEDFEVASNGAANSYYQIRYETTIDRTSVKNVLTETQTNSISGLKNQVAFYLQKSDGKEAKMIITDNKGSIMEDDGSEIKDNWDNNDETTKRYQANYNVIDSANYISPLIDVKGQTVTKAMGSNVETYKDYSSTTPVEPAEMVAWTIRIGNGNQSDTQTIKAGSKVYVVLPDGLDYAGFGQDASGNESVPGYLDEDSFSKVTDAYGNTVLSWEVNKTYAKNSNDIFRIRTKTKAFSYTTYSVKGYFVPLQDADQEFYDQQLMNSTEYKTTYIYSIANEFEQLSKVDPSYTSKTHYVSDSTYMDVYGELGVAAMLTETDTVGGTKVTTRDDDRIMDVADKDDTVRYTMRLESVQGSATMKDIVFVDRLPSVDDTRNLGLKSRGSEANARLVGDGNFVVRYKANGTAGVTALIDTQYRVEYFFGSVDEQFYGDDYKDVIVSDRWLDKDQVASEGLDYINATAIRVVITDDTVEVKGLGNIEVDYDVKLHEYYIGGRQVINTFGYRTVVGADTELIAEVLPVAYKTEIYKDRVQIKKYLNDSSDTPEDTSFEVRLTGRNTETDEIEYDEVHTVTADTQDGDRWTGETWVYELPFGLEYSIEEVQNPNFKTPVYAKPDISVSSDGTTEWIFKITNERDPRILEAEKIWLDANGEELKDESLMSAVNVELYPADKDGNITGDSIETIVLDEDNNWKASFSGVNRYDSDGNELYYTIKEVDVEGYTGKFVLDEDVFTLTNTLIPGDVELQKESDKEDANLEGAQFELYDAKDSVIGEYTTDKNGLIQVDGLTPGSYYFVETEALESHILDKTPVEFVIEFNPQETVNVSMLNTYKTPAVDPEEPKDPDEEDTSKPNKKPESNDKEAVKDTVKTGDDTNLTYLVVMLGVSLSFIIGLRKYKKTH